MDPSFLSTQEFPNTDAKVIALTHKRVVFSGPTKVLSNAVQAAISTATIPSIVRLLIPVHTLFADLSCLTPLGAQNRQQSVADVIFSLSALVLP